MSATGTLAAGNTTITGNLSATSNANFATTNTSGKVGIGTASPAVALDVSFDGSIQSPVAQFTRGTKKNQIGTDGNGGFIGTTTNDPFLIYTNNAEAGTFDKYGNLGIGTTPYSGLTDGGSLICKYGISVGDSLNSSYATNGVTTFGINYTGYNFAYSQFRRFVAYNGKSSPILELFPDTSAYTLYAGAWSYVSDERVKENISLLTGGLSTVLTLTPKKFDYIDGAKGQIGFVAQDIQPVIPEAVEMTEKGILTLKTNFVIPHLVLAIQQQQDTINELTARIAALEAK